MIDESITAEFAEKFGKSSEGFEKLAAGNQTVAEEADHGLLRFLDLGVAAGQLPHHPAGEDLLEGAVEDRRGQLGIDLGPELARLLAASDDPLERLVGVADL